MGDPYYPDLGNGGYDVDRYVLDLTWDPDRERLEGTATIEATATHSLSSFNLDLHGMEIEAITVDGLAASHSRKGDEVTVVPQSPIAAGAEFVTAVDYRGRPTSVPMAGFASGGWVIGDDVAFVAGEPSSSRNWHPANDHPSDQARFRISFTVPGALSVAANGSLVERRNNPDGTVTWVYETRDSQAPYLTTVAIGDLIRVEEGMVRGVPMRSWFERDALAELPRFEPTARAMEIFVDLFGPYPFEAYGSLVVDHSIGGALETQTLSIFGSDYFDGSDLTRLITHELAHQWFGNHIRVADWSEIWLNEGFATYAEFLYQEAADSSYDIDAAMAALSERWGSRLAVPPPGDPSAELLFAPTVYLRGALTLHALRLTIGDEAFFATLTEYLSEFGGGTAETEDFVAVAESVSGADLDELFESWLFADEVPDLPTR